MAGNTGGKGMKRLLSGVLSLFLALVAIAAVWLGAVLIKNPAGEKQDSFVVEEEQTPVTPLQAASSTDAAELARRFGAFLPVLPGAAFSGEARNAEHDGQAVRMVVLRYDGVEVRAVRPVSAAPLLLHGELSVDLRSDLSVLNLPAVLAHRENAYCLYFSNDAAAYAVYAPNAPKEDFLALIGRLSAVH